MGKCFTGNRRLKRQQWPFFTFFPFFFPPRSILFLYCTGTARTGSRNPRTTVHGYHEPFGIRGGACRRSNEEGVFFQPRWFAEHIRKRHPLRTPEFLDFGYTVGRVLYLPTSIKGSSVNLATVFSSVAKFRHCGSPHRK